MVTSSESRRVSRVLHDLKASFRCLSRHGWRWASWPAMVFEISGEDIDFCRWFQRWFGPLKLEALCVKTLDITGSPHEKTHGSESWRAHLSVATDTP